MDIEVAVDMPDRRLRAAAVAATEAAAVAPHLSTRTEADSREEEVIPTVGVAGSQPAVYP